MNQHLVGIKTETWFKVVYNHERRCHEKHSLIVESYLWATKGWRVGRRYKRININCRPYPKIGHSVRFK